ncbi:MAG: DUF3179 domain-containing protein, partial [Solirubrobacterales bacterium]|nr:DUF3179 domain-containing protein [Solirubrobacterales bacterium]
MRPRPLLPLLLVVALGLSACGESGSGAAAGGGKADARTAAKVAKDRFGDQWTTDFSQASVPFAEIMDGGPPRDGIPPIDDPKAVGLEAGDAILSPEDPVMVVEVGGEARAYPIRIMIWHEIANDTLGGKPIAVTYCPLCNSAIVFERELDGRTLTFRALGDGRFGDRQTGSTWDITGRAVSGKLAGERLERLEQ